MDAPPSAMFTFWSGGMPVLLACPWVLSYFAYINGLYYKHMAIVNDDSSDVNKFKLHLLTMLESSFTIITC
jgi:hypothetical protein